MGSGEQLELLGDTLARRQEAATTWEQRGPAGCPWGLVSPADPGLQEPQHSSRHRGPRAEVWPRDVFLRTLATGDRCAGLGTHRNRWGP